MVAADRPSLEVENNPAGSHLFLVSSKELLYTALAGYFFALMRNYRARIPPPCGSSTTRFVPLPLRVNAGPVDHHRRLKRKAFG